MALKQIFKISRKTFINLSGWLGYDMLSSQTKSIWNIVTDLFKSPTPVRTETFQQAMERQGITKSDIKQIESNYYIFFIVFGLLGLFTLVFGFYLLFHHTSVSGWLLAIATSALFFAYSLRYNFWHFQIKNRKLGCTWEEWKRDKINERGPSS